MTWAEVKYYFLISEILRLICDQMLMKILWPGEYENTTCKSIWGSDPYFVSPDLAPHARFVTPQCGKLVQGKSTILNLFVANNDRVHFRNPFTKKNKLRRDNVLCRKRKLLIDGVCLIFDRCHTYTGSHFHRKKK